MKMSDVFDLPLEYAGQCYQDQSGECVGGTNYEKETAMVHATNNHDELVEALEGMIEANKCKEIASPHWVASRQAKAIAILNKAKGLDK